MRELLLSNSFIGGVKFMKEFGAELARRRLAKGWTKTLAAQELGVHAKTITRWERGDYDPQPHHIPAIRRIYDFSQSEIDRYLGVSSGVSEGYQVRKFTDFFASNNRLTGFAERMHQIEDGEFPIPDVPGNDYGDDAEWEKVYETCHETGCVVTSDDGEIAAYWFFVPVVEEVVEKGLQGDNINADFNIGFLDEFSLPGMYEVYFVSLFTRAKFSNPVVHQHLLFSFQDTLLGMAEKDIFVRRIFGNMSSPRMVSLARKLGFEEMRDHKTHIMEDRGRRIPTKVFGINLMEEGSDHILEHTPRLLDLYKEARRENKNA